MRAGLEVVDEEAGNASILEAMDTHGRNIVHSNTSGIHYR